MANIPQFSIKPTGTFQVVKSGASDLGVGIYTLQANADFWLVVNSTDPNTDTAPSALKIRAYDIHPIEIKTGEKAYVKPEAACDLNILT